MRKRTAALLLWVDHGSTYLDRASLVRETTMPTDALSELFAFTAQAGARVQQMSESEGLGA